jgi:hypothetical protein
VEALVGPHAPCLTFSTGVDERRGASALHAVRSLTQRHATRLGCAMQPRGGASVRSIVLRMPRIVTRARWYLAAAWGSLLLRFPPFNRAPQIQGPRWRVYWVGGNDPDREAIASAMDAAYEHVANLVVQDLDVCRQRVPPVRVVCADVLGMDALLTDLKIAHVSGEPAFGMFLPGLATAFVGGHVRHPRFVGALSHEICHAVCSGLCRGFADPLWATEGYATLVEHSMLNPGAVLFTIIGDIASEVRPPIPGVARIVADHVDDTNGGGCSQWGALLLSYLRERRATQPCAWKVAKAAILGALPAGRRTVDALETAFGESVLETQAGFAAFCRELSLSGGDDGASPQRERGRRAGRN